MEIILASNNLHKLREFRDMFKSLAHIELVSLHEFHDYVQGLAAGIRMNWLTSLRWAEVKAKSETVARGNHRVSATLRRLKPSMW